jgi:FkbH-like protein
MREFSADYSDVSRMIKLIIWDLDDTLWQGTLADGETVTLHAHRAEMIRAFNARGVVSSICSKNDFETARARLTELGLWDEFVFPHIAFTPKPAAIQAIIEDMQLRPANVLFVDDNAVNLGEVRHCLPDIQTLDITAPNADDHLAGLLAMQTGGRSRIDEYRILERKKQDRTADASLSNEDFLRSCEIKACAPFIMDNLDFSPRIVELINRSNQLNYTASRVEQRALETAIIDVVGFDSWSILAWDKYGRYGLIGFVMVDRPTQRFVHFTFSCRVMHMGLEEYALDKVREKWPDIDSSAFDGRFSRTTPDWIEDCAFHDPEIRDQLLTDQLSAAAVEPAIRIMFDCQSAGIAHFSRFRPAIAFDSNPRLFALRHMDDGSYLEQHFPPLLVYGTTVDYLDQHWPGQWHLLERGVYERCVLRLCIFLIERGLRMLVVLPPENAPDDKYRIRSNHTRERTRHFNALWRRFARENPEHLWVLELDHIIEGDEMADVTHYYAGLLQKIAGQVDCWVQDVALSGGDAETAEAA